MLLLLTLLTAGYFALVVWVLRGKRRNRAEQTAAGEGAGAAVTALPEDDQPPESAVGWPPAGRQFTSYVDEGFAALDAYLSEGFAA